MAVENEGRNEMMLNYIFLIYRLACPDDEWGSMGLASVGRLFGCGF
jgi:hypothetical protein